MGSGEEGRIFGFSVSDMYYWSSKKREPPRFGGSPMGDDSVRVIHDSTLRGVKVSPIGTTFIKTHDRYESSGQQGNKEDIPKD
jgi:hypothetical protein